MPFGSSRRDPPKNQVRVLESDFRGSRSFDAAVAKVLSGCEKFSIKGAHSQTSQALLSGSQAHQQTSPNETNTSGQVEFKIPRPKRHWFWVGSNSAYPSESGWPEEPQRPDRNRIWTGAPVCRPSTRSPWCSLWWTFAGRNIRTGLDCLSARESLVQFDFDETRMTRIGCFGLSWKLCSEMRIVRKALFFLFSDFSGSLLFRLS